MVEHQLVIRIQAQLGALRFTDLPARTHHNVARAFPQSFDELFCHVRSNAVVGVRKLDVFPSRLGQSPVARTGNTRILLPDDAHAAVQIRPVPADLRRTVRASVVDQNQFEIPERLAQN